MFPRKSGFSLKTLIILLIIFTLVFNLFLKFEESDSCSLPSCFRSKFVQWNENATRTLHARNELRKGETLELVQKRFTAISLRLSSIEISLTQLNKSYLQQQDNLKELRNSFIKEKSTLEKQQSDKKKESLLKKAFKKDKDCRPRDDQLFPFCTEKFETFESLYRKSCYSGKHKMNISDPCSKLVFLSEVEPWCPRLPWRPPRKEKTQKYKASIRTNKNGLLDLLKHDRLAWMRMRIESMWKEWVQAVTSLQKQQNMNGRTAQRILVLLGGFINNPYFLDLAFKGGPLGELVQWTDVISALYILGHDLVILANPSEFDNTSFIQQPVNNCADDNLQEEFDQIFTDINGWNIVADRAMENYAKYRCKIRLLDSFGTEAEFNLGAKYPYPIPGGQSKWSGSQLNLQQIMTFYPHSPDNVFLGFAVPSSTLTGDNKTRPVKKLQGLVYGKDAVYFIGKQKYLNTLHKYLDIHATLRQQKSDFVPSYVTNHGVVNNTQLTNLLQQSKVFIGLGFPFEGPGPLDAIANGCFFINPKIRPPKDRLNSDFLKEKPFLRKITSQNPYAEDFIGRPYVYTIDINNKTEVENTIKKILSSKEIPKLPYEFTHEGFLQRLNFFVENLEFCKYRELFPQEELKVVISKDDKSCKDACFNKGFLCEPSFFRLLNTKNRFERHGLNCKSFLHQDNLLAPSLNVPDGTCLLQKHPLLYSCVARRPHTKRLCPCRSYQRKQVALCKGCSQ